MSKRNSYIPIMLIVYILIIISKDYLINLFLFMNNTAEGLTYLSLKSALLQAGVLIVGGLTFFLIKYKKKCDEAVYNSENEMPNFAQIAGFVRTSTPNVLFSFLIGFVSYVAFNSMKNIYIVCKLYFAGEMYVPAAANAIGISEFLTLLLVFSVWIVLGEEIVYRSMMFSQLFKESKSQRIATVFSVFVFVAAHNSIEQMIQAAFLATILCMVIQKTDSIIPCIAIHFTYNTLGIINTYYYPTAFLEMFGYQYGMTNIDILVSVVKVLIVSLVASAILFIFLKEKMLQVAKSKTEASGTLLKPSIIILMLFIVGYSLIKMATA